jgi:hypothetical protein
MDGVLSKLAQGLFGLGENKERHTYGGIPTREPYPLEAEFFKRSGVPGYAAEDNRVVLNPGILSDPNMVKALSMNEAARVWMRNNNLTPNFGITPQQNQFFANTPYGTAPEQTRRETLAARLLSGDPSAGTATPEQEAFVKRLRYAMGIR